jgi:hypothetical protein
VGQERDSGDGSKKFTKIYGETLGILESGMGDVSPIPPLWQFLSPKSMVRGLKA